MANMGQLKDLIGSSDAYTAQQEANKRQQMQGQQALAQLLQGHQNKLAEGTQGHEYKLSEDVQHEGLQHTNKLGEDQSRLGLEHTNKLSEAAQLKSLETQKAVEEFKLAKRAALDPQLQGLVNDNGSFQYGKLTFGKGAPDKAAALTPAQKSAETAAGKTIQDYETAGGKAHFDRNLGLMESVSKELGGNPETGAEAVNRSGWTRAAGVLPKTLRELLTPEEVSREDRVRSAAQESLRQTLGAQFTANEGEQIMNRAYNPRLSNEENIKRIQSVAAELQQKKQAIEDAAKNYHQTGFATIGQPAAPSAPLAPPPATQYAGPPPSNAPAGNSLIRGNNANAGADIPPGMKLQINKKTGQSRLVPIK